MSLTFWNAEKARKAAEQKALETSIVKEISTSPAKSGVEVEKEETKQLEQLEPLEEVKPKRKKRN